MTAATGSILTDDQTDILAVLKNYWKGADNRDALALDQAFHEDYRVIALTKDGRRVIPKQDYLDLIGREEIGGNSRAFELASLSIDGSIAQGRVLLKGGAVTFHDHITLIREDGRWRMIMNVTEMTAA